MMQKGKKRGKQLLALLLCMIMLMPTSFGSALAAGVDDTGLCEHHTEHTADCGYIAAVEGHECNHQHDETCGYVEAVPGVDCDKGCTDTNGDGIVDHAEDCAYIAPVEGHECTHQHDETCGYVEAVQGADCTYECEICAAAQKDPSAQTGSVIGETLDGDYAYISAAYLVADTTTASGYAIRTGSEPFDADDNAGHDSTDLNNTVRNEDTVTYTVAFESKVREGAEYTAYKTGTLHFEFVLPGTSTQVQFATDSMSWLESKTNATYAVTEETYSEQTYQVLRGSFLWDSADENPAIGESTQSLGVAIKVLAMNQDDAVQPKFTFWLEGNNVPTEGLVTDSNSSCKEHAEAEYKTVAAPAVTVTAAKSQSVGEADVPEAVTWDLSKSKEATNLDANFESRVTLSLPAGDYKGDLDVVFVLDGSTSTDQANLAASAAGLLDELAQFENLNVKAGVIIFGGSTPLLYSGELLALNADSLATLKNVLSDTSYDGMSGRSGSNLQAGVIAGQKLLNADSAVADSDKYLILLTDGGARMWVNENGEAMHQGYRQTNAESVSWNSNQDFASRYIEAESPKTLRTFDEVYNAGATDESFAQYGMTQAEAAQPDAWKNAATWETVCNDQDAVYYTSLEVSTYYAATSIIDAGKHAHVIWVDYPYHSPSKYAEYTDSFKSWLNQKGYITRYDSTATDPETIFANVKDQLIYLLDAGSYVVDYMGYVDGDYNLDFVNDAKNLKLTVGGVEKTVVALGTNSYGFGSQLESGKYEYELTYSPANDATENFKFTINVPVTKDMPVKLAYTVKLVNPKTAPGTYGVYDQFGANNDGSATYSLYTNNKATLTPVDSNGNTGTPEDFKKPTVSYTVTGVERTVVKVWAGDTEAVRPTKAVVQLLKNGALYATVTLNAENEWTYTWSGLPEYNQDGTKIAWSVAEQEIANYDVVITQDGTTFTVTNTYDPTVTRTVIKVWNDKGYESKRPSSVQVLLLKNGETYDAQRLNSANGWQFTWSKLPQYDDNGKEISWSIYEKPISSYVASVSQNGDTFVLTNTFNSQKLLQTGALWWPIPVLVCTGLAFITAGMLSKKKKAQG